MELITYIEKGYSVEIRVLHRGSYWDGWGFESHEEIELEASWKISINSKDLDTFTVELCSFETPNEVSNEFDSEEIVVTNKDKSIIGKDGVPLIDTLNKAIYFMAHFRGHHRQEKFVYDDYLTLENGIEELFDYFNTCGDESYKLFSEVVEIKYSKGKKEEIELFIGSSMMASNVDNGLFKLLSLLKLKQKLPYYHVPPRLSSLGLRIKGIKPIIYCAVPLLEGVNLLSMLRRFDEYQYFEDPELDVSLNEINYSIPTLNGRAYMINLGDILEVFYECDEFNYPIGTEFDFINIKNRYYSMPKINGQLYMPKNVRVLYKGEDHFVDYSTDYISDALFVNHHLKKGNNPIFKKAWSKENINLEIDRADLSYINIFLRNVSFLALDVNTYGREIYRILGFHYDKWAFANDTKSELIYLNSEGATVNKNGRSKRT